MRTINGLRIVHASDRPVRVWGYRVPSRKAVSPVIATLLMVAITVAAAIIVYVWSTGLIGSIQGSGGQHTKDQLSLDAWTCSTTACTLNLRNVGSGALTVDKIFVNGASATFSGSADYPILNGHALTVTVPSGPCTRGQALQHQIALTSGAVSGYTVMCGRFG